MNFVKSATVLSVLCLSGLSVKAQSIASSCYMKPDSHQIVGRQIDTLTPIASVSKVFTTYWALMKRDPQFRFETKVHVTPVEGSQSDVHFEGSLDPSFNSERLVLLMSELSSRGLGNIRNLTYDENFKYLDAVYEGPAVAGDPEKTILGPAQIMIELREKIGSSSLNQSYANLRASRNGKIGEFSMPETISVSIVDISYKARSNFLKTPMTRSFTSKSTPLVSLLKEMNTRSNNYLANLIFDSLGGPLQFREFLAEKFSFSRSVVNFQNGSGNPIEDDKGRFDNKATCRAIVTVAKALRERLTGMNLRMASVMAVDQDPRATIARYGNNEITRRTLAAKSGTARPVVSLAGLSSTKSGVIYFSIVVRTGDMGLAPQGRAIINREIQRMVRENGGGDPIDMESSETFSFDSISLLEDDSARAPLQ